MCASNYKNKGNINNNFFDYLMFRYKFYMEILFTHLKLCLADFLACVLEQIIQYNVPGEVFFTHLKLCLTDCLAIACVLAQIIQYNVPG